MDNEYFITYDGELYHWGIKGMKWGVRRYQNADGSLTAAGRKRYIGSDGKLTKAGQKYYAKEAERLKNERKTLNAQKKSEAKLSKLEEMRSGNNALKKQSDTTVVDANKKKSVKDMTDAELDAAINRARKEDTYRQLRPETSPKTQSFMDKLLKDAIVPATVDAGKKAITKLVDDMLKTKADPNSYEALKKTYDTLKLKKDLEDLKSGKEKINWSDETAKYNLERRKAQDAKKDADDAAKEASKKAADDKKKAKEQAYYDYYNKQYTETPTQTVSGSYRQTGGEKTYVNPRISGYLTSGVSLSDVVTSSSVSTGSSFVSKYGSTPIASLPSPNIAGYLPAPKDRDD